MAINVNMLVERFTIDAQPRWKKGHPPQSTTGVARSNSIHGVYSIPAASWTVSDA